MFVRQLRDRVLNGRYWLKISGARPVAGSLLQVRDISKACRRIAPLILIEQDLSVEDHRDQMPSHESVQFLRAGDFPAGPGVETAGVWRSHCRV